MAILQQSILRCTHTKIETTFQALNLNISMLFVHHFPPFMRKYIPVKSDDKSKVDCVKLFGTLTLHIGIGLFVYKFKLNDIKEPTICLAKLAVYGIVGLFTGSAFGLFLENISKFTPIMLTIGVALLAKLATNN